MGTPLRWDTPGLHWDDPNLFWDGTLPGGNAMPYGNIDVSLTAAQKTAITTAIAAVEALMPWLVVLTDDERRRLYKAGNKLEAILASQNAVVANPTIFPGSFDAAGFGHDVDFYNDLTELTAVLAALWRKVDDTRMAVGSECIKTVTTVRGYVDSAAKTMPGLQATSAELAEFFKRSSPAPTTPPPGP